MLKRELVGTRYPPQGACCADVNPPVNHAFLDVLLTGTLLHSPLSSMKFFPATVAALALIASSHGLALPAGTLETTPTDPLAAHSADLMVSGYLDSLESLLGADPAKALALIEDLRAQCLRIDLPGSLKSDLIAASEGLLERLGGAHLEWADLELLRLEIVNARISHGLQSMTQAAERNEWSQEELHSAVMKWLAVTTIFNDAPAHHGHRARVTAALELAMLQATGTAAAGYGLTVEMLRLRLASALRRYQLAFERGHLTAVELDRLSRIAIIRMRRIVKANF